MYRGTTPQIKLTLDADVDFSQVTALWVTFKGISASVSKSIDQVVLIDETNEIRVDLSQEETLKLKHGVVQVQVRFKTNTGRAYATSIAELSLNEILKEGVI